MKNQSTQTSAFGWTIEEFIKQHYFSRIEKKLSPNTVRFYRSVVEQFILPSFGHLRLIDVTIKHQQTFVEYLSSEGTRADEKNHAPLAAATVKRYATVFASIMTEACRMGLIEENKFKQGSVEYPKALPQLLRVYNDDEAKAFFESLYEEPPKIRLMLLCALLLGLRRGEIVALRWSDVNLHNRSLSVSQSAYKSKGEPQDVKSPKSRSGIRTVYFSEAMVVAMDEWKNVQAQEKSTTGAQWKEQDYIFTNEVGDMISLYAPTRICSQFEAKHGLHHLKLHGLRHTCGSLMASNGIDPETIKTVLGHESLDTTNLYIHPYETNLRKAANLLDHVVAKRKDEVPA
jgi:integrase